MGYCPVHQRDSTMVCPSRRILLLVVVEVEVTGTPALPEVATADVPTTTGGETRAMAAKMAMRADTRTLDDLRGGGWGRTSSIVIGGRGMQRC